MTEQEVINRLDTLPEREKQAFILNTIGTYPSFLRIKNRLANLYITKGKLLKARMLLESELAKAYNIHLQITLANLELKSNHLEAARTAIIALRKRNPKTPHGYVLLGRLHKEEGNNPAAINAFQEAHRINPKISGPVLYLQEIYIKETAFQKAMSILSSGVKHNPNNFFFRMRRAHVWSELGDKQKAERAFEKAKQLATNDNQAGNAALQLAVINKDQVSENEVIAKLRQFSSHYPSHIGLKLNLVRYLTNAKLFNEALTAIEELQHLAPEDNRALASKAAIYHRQGLNEQAESICDQVLLKNPTQINSILLKANLLIAKEKAEEAFLLYNKALIAHPTSPWPYAGMAQLLYQEGNIQAAFSIIAKGTKQAVNTNQLKYKHIQFLMNIGDFEKAMALIAEKKQSSKTYDHEAVYLEMQVFQRKGDFEKVKEVAKQFLENCVNHSIWEHRILSFLSATAFLEYDYPTSEKILSDLVTKAQDANMMHNRLALLYLLKGDLERAKKQLKIATQEIEEKKVSGKVFIPLIGHTAKVLNEIQINPRLKVKAVECFKYIGEERLQYLAKLNDAHPDYFGFSLYLSNELRAQGLFEQIKKSLNKQEQNIPKTIIQYWDTGSPPDSVKMIMDSWKKHNPEYQYKLFTRKSAYSFIKLHLDRNEAKAFLNCEHPAMQADFFRLAYLSKKGGFYADADDKCVSALDSLIDSGAELILKLGDFGCISNNFLGSAPNNKIINDAYKKGIKNMTTYFNEGPWFKLGPGHLTKSVTHTLAHYIDEKDFSKWPKIYMLDQIDTRKYISQHLSLPYKSSDKSWFTAEYKKTITNRKHS